jgi:hypothetical protein
MTAVGGLRAVAAKNATYKTAFHAIRSFCEIFF